MDTKDAGRIGGLSRSEYKKAASSRNLAKARATVAAALASYNAAQDGEPKAVALSALKVAVVEAPTPRPKWDAMLDGKQTPEYRAYHDARNRCTNPKSTNWPNYGARGIKFLFENFDQFMDAIGGLKPAPEYQLDRRNNDGHYEPGNVRWVTPKENTNNQGRNAAPPIAQLLLAPQEPK